MSRINIRVLAVATASGLFATGWLAVASGPSSAAGFVAALAAGMAVGGFIAGTVTWVATGRPAGGAS
jgi:hypothetical protein